MPHRSEASTQHTSGEPGLRELRNLLEAKHAELVDRVDRSIVAGIRVDDRTFPDSIDAATRVQEEDELIDFASRV